MSRTTIRTMAFTVNAIQFNEEAFKAFRAAEQQAEKLRGELIEAFKKSDRFKAAIDLSRTSDYGTKIAPAISLSGGLFHVSLSVDEISPSATPPRPHLHVDPKLVNSLLHGKLLTDAEKRNLIESIAPGVLIQAEGGAE